VEQLEEIKEVTEHETKPREEDDEYLNN